MSENGAPPPEFSRLAFLGIMVAKDYRNQQDSVLALFPDMREGKVYPYLTLSHALLPPRRRAMANEMQSGWKRCLRIDGP